LRVFLVAESRTGDTRTGLDLDAIEARYAKATRLGHVHDWRCVGDCSEGAANPWPAIADVPALVAELRRLAAADAADRDAGIIRVQINDAATVDRVAAAILKLGEPRAMWVHLDRDDRDEFRIQARAVLAALGEATE
jgi:hypothetical protein